MIGQEPEADANNRRQSAARVWMAGLNKSEVAVLLPATLLPTTLVNPSDRSMAPAPPSSVCSLRRPAANPGSNERPARPLGTKCPTQERSWSQAGQKPPSPEPPLAHDLENAARRSLRRPALGQNTTHRSLRQPTIWKTPLAGASADPPLGKTPPAGASASPRFENRRSPEPPPTRPWAKHHPPEPPANLVFDLVGPAEPIQGRFFRKIASCGHGRPQKGQPLPILLSSHRLGGGEDVSEWAGAPAYSRLCVPEHPKPGPDRHSALVVAPPRYDLACPARWSWVSPDIASMP